MKIADAFSLAIKKSNQPLYVIGPLCGFHPRRLSRLRHGEEVKRPHDVRFKLLANIVGFEGDLFENEKNSRMEAS